MIDFDREVPALRGGAGQLDFDAELRKLRAPTGLTSRQKAEREARTTELFKPAPQPIAYEPRPPSGPVPGSRTLPSKVPPPAAEPVPVPATEATEAPVPAQAEFRQQPDVWQDIASLFRRKREQRPETAEQKRLREALGHGLPNLFTRTLLAAESSVPTVLGERAARWAARQAPDVPGFAGVARLFGEQVSPVNIALTAAPVLRAGRGALAAGREALALRTLEREAPGAVEAVRALRGVSTEAPSVLLERPGVATATQDMVTVYHGEGGAQGAGLGGDWFTTDPQRAASFGEVSTVQVPRQVVEAGRAEARRLGSGTGSDVVLPASWARKANPISVARKAYRLEVPPPAPVATPAIPPVSAPTVDINAELARVRVDSPHAVGVRPAEELTLGQFVRRNGGINLSQSQMITGELAAIARGPAGHTTNLVRARTGLSADRMAQFATEAGFRAPNGDPIDTGNISSILADEIRGKPTYSIKSVEAMTAQFEKRAREAERTMWRGGLPTRTETIAQATRANAAEAEAEAVAQGQVGAVRIPPFSPREPGTPGLSAQTRTALEAGRQGQDLRRSLELTRRRVVAYTQYEGLLQFVDNLPAGVTAQKVANDFRLFQNRVQQLIPAQIVEDMAAVVQPLSRPEYGVFQDYIFTREWLEETGRAAAEGRRPSVPFNIPAEQLQADLALLERQLSPAVRSAVARHDRLMGAVTKDLIDRGVLDAEHARQHYMRHFVQDYQERYGVGVGIPRRFREPFRQYGRSRRGSVRAIATDYLDVQSRMLGRVYLDNAVDDFMEKTVQSADLLPRLTQEERVALFGPSGRPRQVGQMLEVNGKPATTWQYHPGNYLYPAETVDAEIINQAVAGAMTPEEFQAAILERHRQAFALGRKRPIVVIDPILAQRLGQFNIPTKGNLFQTVNGYTKIWKRAIIDTLGVPFQMRFLIGHFERFMTMTGDPGALRYFPRASRMVLGDILRGNPGARDVLLKLGLAQAGPEAEEILALAKEQAVLRSGAMGMRRAMLADPRFAHLQGRLAQILRVPEQALTLWESLWQVPQESVRLMKFMKDVDRIKAGGSVVYSGAITGLEGLPPIERAGRVSREAFIDYGARSMFEQQMGSLLTPFITFHYKNLRDWTRLAVRDPRKLAVPTAIYASMVAWNNTGDRAKTEDALPDWLRVAPHVVTGWKTGDGKPVVATFMTASFAAANTIGLTMAGKELVLALRGKKTADRAAHDALSEMGSAVVQQARGYAGPVPELAGALLGKDVRTWRNIVTQRLEGTAAGRRVIAGRVAEQMLPPVYGYQRLRGGLGVGYVSPFVEAGMRAGILKAPDPEAERHRRAVESANRARASMEDKLYAVERAYVDSAGDRAAALRAARQQNFPGGSGELINRMLDSPRVRIELLQTRLKTTRDQAERVRILGAIRRLRIEMEQQRQRTIPEQFRQPAGVP
jgi:hypothetical protein